MLGHLTSLQVHHIFPKTLLYRTGFERGHVNAIANFCFLTQATNLAVGNRRPEDYFAEAEEKHPGVLASQWIPTDPDLWRVERYGDFLAARRELLADAAASFLAELRTGATSDSAELRPVTVRAEDTDDARTVQIATLIEELTRLGYGTPELDSEIADPATGRELAVAEAFWPDGLQPGQGKPTILELDPDPADLPRLEELGYEVFTSVDALLGYVTRRNENAAGEPPAGTAAEPAGVVWAGSDATCGTVGVDGVDGQAHTRRASLAAELEQEMRTIYERARKEAGYHATYFLRMLAEHGGLATARKLLHAPAVSDGFAAMWERGRLDLTVEAVVVQSRFAELFTGAELDTARHRLAQFGYAVP